MSNESYVTSTAAVRPVRERAGTDVDCRVNVTVLVCPCAVAVTVAVCETSATAGGWYTTDAPEVPESIPGPDSDQVTSFASGSGLAVISVGPEMFCGPLGLML